MKDSVLIEKPNKTGEGIELAEVNFIFFPPHWQSIISTDTFKRSPNWIICMAEASEGHVI